MRTKLKFNSRYRVLKIILLFFSFCLVAVRTDAAALDQMQLLKMQQAVQAGKMDPSEVQKILEKMKSGRINAPPGASALIEKAASGKLSPEEIDKAKAFAKETIPEPQVSASKETETLSPPADEAMEETQEQETPESASAEIPSEKILTPIFGHFLFSQVPSTFAPVQNVPVSDTYIIGPGDEFFLHMWGRLDDSYQLMVDKEGQVQFPKIGPIPVAGMTFGEAKKLLHSKGKAITGVHLSVSMGRLRSIQVFVMGEVKVPGLYTISSLASMTNALFASGGPTEIGSLRDIRLKRNGDTIRTLDFYDFLLSGDTTSDARLSPGDVIFLPQAGPMVTVKGNVKREARFELKDVFTLTEALRLAGGFQPNASNQRIQIERAHQNHSNIVVDITLAELNAEDPVRLEDGDVITIFPISPVAANAVYLYGNVTRPGRYAYAKGIRLSNILTGHDLLEMDTYLDYALIKRYHFEEMRASLIPFHLGKMLAGSEKGHDLALHPRDEIYIFHSSQFRDYQEAEIEGAVRHPGKYIIQEDGMRLQDLFFKAGYFTSEAFFGLGHLYRIDYGTGRTTMHTFDVQKANQGDPDNNLVLLNGDRVVIHSIWEYHEQYTVTLKGRVNHPGDFPFADNMTVRDLILVGGNVKDAAFLDEAELVRFEIVEGKKVQTSIHTFNVRKALEGDPLHNLELMPMDVVQIKQIPDWWEEKRSVIVEGEVNFPGNYSIRKEERLSSVLERAGGFSSYAYLRGAVFKRVSVEELQQERLSGLAEKLEIDIARLSSEEVQGALSQEDLLLQNQYVSSQKALLSKLKSVRASGRIIITLDTLEALKGSPDDIVLENGDHLLIPKIPHTVNVLGAVYNPTALVYDESNKSVGHYLAQTGGITASAENDLIYVVRANGSVISKNSRSWWVRTFSDFDRLPMYPGDSVLVPEKVIRPRGLKDVKDITQILYQIATTAGVTAALF